MAIVIAVDANVDPIDPTPVRWAMSAKGAQKLATPVDQEDDGMTTRPTEQLLSLGRAN